MGHHMKAGGRKADDAQAILVIALLGQFARTGTADRDPLFAMAVHRTGQRVAIETVRTK